MLSLARPSVSLSVLALTVLPAGCDQGSVSERAEPTEPAAKPAPGRAAPQLIPGPDDEAVDSFVSERVRAARRGNTDVVVYVGAKWCEPCQHFKRALKAGVLDDDLRGVELIEYDLDRRKDDLARSGYQSRMIPLFALPGDDGRSTPKHIAGSIKGPAAAREITPRLRRLLGR